MRRKGFALVTLLIAILIAMVVGVVVSKMFTPLARGVPKLQRLSYENDRISNMLRNIRKDIDSADALPENFGDITAGDGSLIIRQGRRVICYRMADGKAVREVLESDVGKLNEKNTPAMAEKPETWELPNAKIDFQRWVDEKTGLAYAVAVTSAVIQQEYEHTIEKFANAHVFFLMQGERKLAVK